ncbi:NADH dehydrogenase I subunit 5 protein [Halorhabdus tiamatea SARL4B]|uniref:NADH dehydrogenase I subunit 5 protein n=1 Tax=Halorhabdus tiamatea SARL4B TaxID=1033806 RepID=F7PN53_9EURY|nr:proton-conducting transporter membrane subunit [Halorhabdus tiamatea]ERJ07717.1 NADH dehydrogenase I subunit 5 protein [Halorhabdus tiamatea SARL4B]CCQ32625.1 NADH-ubiquinone oxidoreductase, subunit 5 [Halorhabdus tiamatea SARL4B]
MAGRTSKPTVGALPDATVKSPVVSVVLTWLAWALFAASVAALVTRVRFGITGEIPGVVAVDGLTVLLWVVVSFFSGIVHSYSRRYMAGSAHEERFFAGVFGFTVIVMALVAADHLALFWVLWLAMGLVMAALVGIVEGWHQARAAASVARRYFLASSAFLGIGFVTLWWATGAQTVSGVAAAADGLAGPVWLVSAGAVVLAAMIQSALLPFHTWLLASMTAPTPASALMHAGFVNAGGILLTRFAPVVTGDPTLMLVIVVLGAISALGGKFLKAVQPDVKSRLACSTVGQMGFMIMQAGLGFFGAAITHLVLHGFYKAHHFLSAGEEVEHTAPGGESRDLGVVGFGITLLTGLAGGAVFAVLTGKGLHFDSGLVLALIVTLTTLQAARSVVARMSLPAVLRYGAIPVVFLPAIAGYALVYSVVSTLLGDLPVLAAPTELTVVHGVVVAGFLLAYAGVETGVYKRSARLYVALVNASQPPTDTLLTDRGDYNEQ